MCRSFPCRQCRRHITNTVVGLSLSFSFLYKCVAKVSWGSKFCSRVFYCKTNTAAEPVLEAMENLTSPGEVRRLMLCSKEWECWLRNCNQMVEQKMANELGCCFFPRALYVGPAACWFSKEQTELSLILRKMSVSDAFQTEKKSQLLCFNKWQQPSNYCSKTFPLKLSIF